MKLKLALAALALAPFASLQAQGLSDQPDVPIFAQAKPAGDSASSDRAAPRRGAKKRSAIQLPAPVKSGSTNAAVPSAPTSGTPAGKP